MLAISKSLVKSLSQHLPGSVRSLLKSILFHYRNLGFSPYISDFERFNRRFQFYIGDRIGESWLCGNWDWGEIE